MTGYTPSILCPIDFSEPSRSALSYAAAIADHVDARLSVMAVDDPLLVEAAAAAGIVPSFGDETRRDLERFCGEVLSHRGAGERPVDYRVVTGKPATQILLAAREMNVDLIVMSSRGQSGVRKMFFGSTTERVLRETSVPVLITPAGRAPATSLMDIARHINRVLTPVDLTDVSPPQLAAAHRIAGALSIPLMVVHIIEPIFIPSQVRAAVRGAETARLAQAREQLSSLAESMTPAPETMVLTGEPSEEIVALAEARHANLIVMALHSSTLLGPRMGSVTYRVLCLSHALVLALPPKDVSSYARLDAALGTTQGAGRVF